MLQALLSLLLAWTTNNLQDYNLCRRLVLSIQGLRRARRISG